MSLADRAGAVRRRRTNRFALRRRGCDVHSNTASVVFEAERGMPPHNRYDRNGVNAKKSHRGKIFRRMKPRVVAAAGYVSCDD